MAIVDVFEKHEIHIVLYGSCARGYFNTDSDVDILVLVDMTPEEMCCYRNKLYDMTYDFETKYGIEINPVVQCRKDYEQWKAVYPFYINIEREGIVIYGKETHNCTIHF